MSRLGDVAEVRGRVGWKGYTVEDLTDDGPLVLGANDITSDNRLILADVKHLTREKYEESPEIFVELNDVLVVKVGSTIGKVCIIDDEIGEASINPNCVIVRAKNINPYYLYYFLCTPTGRAFLINNSVASSQPALNQTDLKKLEIPEMDQIEQEKIIGVLNAIKKCIVINEKIIETSEKLMREIYDYWFVQFDFPDENGRPYKSSGGEMVYDEKLKREIPKGWKVVNIEDLAQLTWGQCPDGVNILAKDSEIPSLPYCSGAGDMDGGYIVNCQARTDNSRREVESETILLSIAGTIGKMAIANEKISLGRATLGIAPNDKKYYALVWLLLKMYNSRLKTASVGAVQKIINKSNMKELNIAIPNVANMDYEALNSAMGTIKSLSLENNKLASLRDWLLPMLMNGQIKVSD